MRNVGSDRRQRKATEIARFKVGPAIALSTRVSFSPLPLTFACIAMLGACSPYRAGSFHGGGISFPEDRTTLGCVDFAMRAALDPLADGPVINLHLGNRCSEGVWVDVTSIHMTAYMHEGPELSVDFYDPRDELKRVVLGGKETTVERIELVAPIETQRVCAELDGFAPVKNQGPPKVVCTSVEGGA